MVQDVGFLELPDGPVSEGASYWGELEDRWTEVRDRPDPQHWLAYLDHPRGDTESLRSVAAFAAAALGVALWSADARVSVPFARLLLGGAEGSELVCCVAWDVLKLYTHEFDLAAPDPRDDPYVWAYGYSFRRDPRLLDVARFVLRNLDIYGDTYRWALEGLFFWLPPDAESPCTDADVASARVAELFRAAVHPGGEGGSHAYQILPDLRCCDLHAEAAMRLIAGTFLRKEDNGERLDALAALDLPTSRKLIDAAVDAGNDDLWVTLGLSVVGDRAQFQRAREAVAAGRWTSPGFFNHLLERATDELEEYIPNPPRLTEQDVRDLSFGLDPEPDPAAPMAVNARWAEVLRLYRWQQDALQSWVDVGRCGVIEAVTGVGKTRVALAAIADALSNGYQVAVLVPSVELLRQWRREIEQQLLDHAGLTSSVGQLGAGESETLASCDVLLATLSSASRYQLEPPATGALLVVDEVHRAGAPTWAAALEPGFDQRLGLTATYEREDLGVEEHLDPYFGGVCASVGYGEALRDGVIAPFKVAHVGVRFTPSEQAEYDRFAKQAADRRRQLIDDWGCPAEPFGEFLKAVHRLSVSGIPEGSRVAGFYLSAFSKRRAVLSNATAKFRRLQDLTAAVHAAEKTIVFTQTKQAAADAVAALADGQIAGAVLHAGMDLDARAKVFGGFEDGTHELVAAPRLLDEGVDVPAADLGIVIAASRSRRQMIQRMGRILRRKADGRPARFVIMFVEGSSEDPEQPGHEGFLELITPYALDVQRFDGTAAPAAISRYLEPLTKTATSVGSEWSTEGHEAPDMDYAIKELKEARYSLFEYFADEVGDPSAQYNLGLLLEAADPPDLVEARHWYTAAAEAGHTNAQYSLGLLLVQADPPEYEEARHWWSLAATAGNTHAQYNLGLLLEMADPPEYEEARHWYTAAAEADDPPAQYHLGLLLAHADPPELEEARRWYTAAAEVGHTKAQYNLGALLKEGDPPDLEGARHWYTAAAEAGEPRAQHNLGVLLAQADPPEYEEARHWLSLAATAGNAEGQYSLGLLLMQAYPAEYEEARHWWSLAATAGHTDAQYNLGTLLKEGDPSDLEGARHWYTAAAEAGDPPAQYNLGLLLMQADPPEYEEARHWYTAAAESGHAKAQYSLGLLLVQADPPEYEEARHWWSLAATAGHTPAQNYLGVLLAHADPPEYGEARHWWNLAATAGNADAQYNLGVVLAEADPPEYGEARHWYTAAAESGHSDAQYNLGLLLARADPPEYEEARHWWSLAAEAGHPAAQNNLGILLEAADPPDLEEARRWYTAAAEAGYTDAKHHLLRLLGIT